MVVCHNSSTARSSATSGRATRTSTTHNALPVADSPAGLGVPNGSGEIRTHGTLSLTHTFQAIADHVKVRRHTGLYYGRGDDPPDARVTHYRSAMADEGAF